MFESCNVCLYFYIQFHPFLWTYRIFKDLISFKIKVKGETQEKQTSEWTNVGGENFGVET